MIPEVAKTVISKFKHHRGNVFCVHPMMDKVTFIHDGCDLAHSTNISFHMEYRENTKYSSLIMNDSLTVAGS